MRYLQSTQDHALSPAAPGAFEGTALMELVHLYWRAVKLLAPEKGLAIWLTIASVAIAEGLPLYTRNPDDFAGLDSLVEIVAL